MDEPLACDAYDRGREARSLVGRAVLYSSGFARRPRTPRGGCRAPPASLMGQVGLLTGR